MAELKKLRRQCRRGTLEPDLLPDNFWQRHAATLTAAERALLAQWLAGDDEQLTQQLQNPPPHGSGATLAAKINAPSAGAV